MQQPTRAVTVRTVDAGLVLIPEPAWCLGEHDDGGHLADIIHSGPEAALSVATTRGPVRTLLACLEQRPFTDRTPPGRGVFAAVELGADWYPYDAAGLEELAAGVVNYAERLRALARQLAALGGGGR